MDSPPKGILVYKIAALLHDPVWKPWVISAAFNGVGRVFAKIPGRTRPAASGVRGCEEFIREVVASGSTQAHTLDAAAAAYGILSRVDDELARHVERYILESDGVVQYADRLAASLDRWILTYQSTELRRVRVGYKDACYVNPLDPKFRYCPTYPEAGEILNRVCEYVRGLADLMANSANLPLPVIYNTLLFVLEPLWYSVCRNCIPLADTRTPTHTVFDHVYATASMVNWVHGGGGRLDGFLVKLDIAGIQGFISQARKTRDLWAGSWLVSALAWYTVAEAVMLLGADIVLSPYPLANHFFIATLLQELNLHGANIVSTVEKLARRAFLWSGAANQPIVPGTFFLALPCIDEEEKNSLLEQARRMKTVDPEAVEELLDALTFCDAEKLRSYFLNRFREAWEKVASSVAETYAGNTGFVERLEKARLLDGWSVDEASRYLEAASREPPLRLRVVAVPVHEVYDRVRDRLKSILQKLAGVMKGININFTELVGKLIFHYMFAKALPDAISKALEGNLTIEPGYRIAGVLEWLTGRVFNNPNRGAPGFHECSMCGRLPSLVHVDDDTRQNLPASMDIPPSMFTSGERLCPYCLLRRLMTLNKPLRKIMHKFNLYSSSKTIYPRVPSTSELSAMRQYIKLIDLLAANNNILNEIMNAIKDTPIRGDPANYVAAPLRAYIKNTSGDADVILYALGVLEAYYDISELVARGGLREERACSEADLPESLCRVLREAAERAGLTASRYYAIVRGDGDYFGKRIVRGILDYPDSAEYVRKLVENGIRDEGSRVTLQREYTRYAELLTLLIKELADLPRRPTVLVTPAYYAAMSRGQMVTALYDAAIVASLGGFPVYAGGDDVAALLPGYIEPEKLWELVNAYTNEVPAPPHLQDAVATRPNAAVTGSAAAAAVVLTRRNYWGLLSSVHGFHETPIGGLYPAPVAYGRSYGVYIAHYRDPFQAVWRAAGDLEEMKDQVTVCKAERKNQRCVSICSEKDLTFLSYGRVAGVMAAGETAVLPNLKPCGGKQDVVLRGRAGATSVAGMLEHAAMLLERVLTRSISRSIIYDFERESELAGKLADRVGSCDKWAEDAAARFAEMLVKRNAQSGAAADEAYRLLRGCGDNVYTEAGGARYLSTWQVIKAVKILLAARR